MYLSSDFIEFPSSVNTSVEREAHFNCTHSTALGIIWNFNGTDLNRGRNHFPSGVTDINMGAQHTLVISAITNYNELLIICVAILRDSTREETPPVSLLIQGKAIKKKY